jgi:hypothetical protein
VEEDANTRLVRVAVSLLSLEIVEVTEAVDVGE